jgi:hypothetical protein
MSYMLEMSERQIARQGLLAILFPSVILVTSTVLLYPISPTYSVGLLILLFSYVTIALGATVLVLLAKKYDQSASHLNQPQIDGDE